MTGFSCLICVERTVSMYAVEGMCEGVWVHAAVQSLLVSVLLLSNEEQKADRRSTR